MGPAPSEQRVQRWALLRSSSLLTDRTRVRLYRLSIERGDDAYLVRRVDTGSTISTGETGIDCIERLRRGETMGEMRHAVGLEHQCPPEEVDVLPLLDCLVEADFIESIDDYPVSSAPRSGLDTLRQVVGASLWAPLLASAARRLPLRLLLPLAHRRWRGRDRRILGLIAAHMRMLPGLRATPADVPALARANYDGLTAQYMDRVLLAMMRPARLHRWLTGYARVRGLGHLDEALARGRGVLLCAFHTGSYTLTPFVLAAHGHAVSVLTGMGEAGDLSLARRLDESRAAGYDYRIEPVGGSLVARPLLRALQQGKVALLLSDAGPADSRRSLEVDFLGGRVRAAPGPGWLACRSGATPLPVISRRAGGWRHEVIIEPPLELRETGAAGVAEAVAGLYRVLERHVLRDPALWLKWKDLPAFASAPR